MLYIFFASFTLVLFFVVFRTSVTKMEQEVAALNEQKRKDIKEKLVSTAFEYLVENGLENSSIRDLCKAIGISTGSMYYWFDGKESIYISAVKYGINKVSSSLFQYAFDTMHSPRKFFKGYLSEIDKYKKEFRLIIQVASSPLYGEVVRTSSLSFKAVYDKYIDKLSDIIGCTPIELAPVIYSLISILTDYVIWEDKEVSVMQVEFLYESLDRIRKKEEGAFYVC